MKNKVVRFLTSQRGINTVEVVIILAIMVGLAIIFKDQLAEFANKIMSSVFKYEPTDFVITPTPSAGGTP
jgi:Flp pilus assembly pilin Flp